MYGYRRPHKFYFDYELERGDDLLEVEVTYTIDGSDVQLESVTHNGQELVTSTEEDKELLNAAVDRANDDYEDAEASYGDYVYESRRDGDY